MKVIFILFSLVSTAAFACIDLSGNYICRNQDKKEYQMSISVTTEGGKTYYSFLPGSADPLVPDTMLADGKVQQAVVNGKILDNTTYIATCNQKKLLTKVVWYMDRQLNHTTHVERSFDKKGNLIVSLKSRGVTFGGTFDRTELSVCKKQQQ